MSTLLMSTEDYFIRNGFYDLNKLQKIKEAERKEAEKGNPRTKIQDFLASCIANNKFYVSCLTPAGEKYISELAQQNNIN